MTKSLLIFRIVLILIPVWQNSKAALQWKTGNGLTCVISALGVLAAVKILILARKRK